MAKAEGNREQAPRQLAERKFGKLATTELKLLEAFAVGEAFDCSGDGGKGAVRANLIRWLCTDSTASTRLSERGVDLHNAQIVGLLDFSFAKIEFPLAFADCIFEDPILLEYASCKAINMARSSVGEVFATGLHVTDDLLMNGLESNGCLALRGARIGGSIEFDGALFV